MDPATLALLIGAGGGIASGILGASGTHQTWDGPTPEQIAHLTALNRNAAETRIQAGQARQSRGIAAGAAASGTLNSGMAERGFGDAAANADAARAEADARVQEQGMRMLAMRRPRYYMDRKGIAGQILGRVTAPATAIGLAGLIPQLLGAHGVLPGGGSTGGDSMGGALNDAYGGFAGAPGPMGGSGPGVGDYAQPDMQEVYS